jgi:hypothetical protein
MTPRKATAKIPKAGPDPFPMLNAAPLLIVKFKVKKFPINFFGFGPKYFKTISLLE